MVYNLYVHINEYYYCRLTFYNFIPSIVQMPYLLSKMQYYHVD